MFWINVIAIYDAKANSLTHRSISVGGPRPVLDKSACRTTWKARPWRPIADSGECLLT